MREYSDISETEGGMPMVGDLREALQDVVARDLKAVGRGLIDLKEEVRAGNTLLREEMQHGNELLRREIEQPREEARENTAVLRVDTQQNIALVREDTQQNIASLREDTRQHMALMRDEMRAFETRSIERMEHLHGALQLALVTPRFVDAEKQIEAA